MNPEVPLRIEGPSHWHDRQHTETPTGAPANVDEVRWRRFYNTWRGWTMATDRMCVRQGCERIGLKTTSKRCQSCGFVTSEWDDGEAERLRSPAGPAAPHPTFRVGIPVSTANEVPGWEITAYVGEIFGLVVRSRGAFPQLGANLKSVFGGELTTMTNLLRETREQAVARLVEEAEHRGADAVIGMRFDVTTMGDTAGWTEVCAYGTAVSARPIIATSE